MESFKDRQEQIQNSPQFQRANYVRRKTGLYILPLMSAAIIAAFLAEKFLNISGYIGCSITGVVAIGFAVMLAEKSAAKKFEKKDI